jgi:hypothetical protein
MNHHGAQPQAAAGALDAQGDLAAVGNQDGVEHGGSGKVQQRLARFDFLARVDEHRQHRRIVFGADLVEHLHGLDHAQSLAGHDGWPGARRAAPRCGLQCTTPYSGARQSALAAVGATASSMAPGSALRATDARRAAGAAPSADSFTSPQAAAVLAELQFRQVRCGQSVDERLDLFLLHAGL